MKHSRCATCLTVLALFSINQPTLATEVSAAPVAAATQTVTAAPPPAATSAPTQMGQKYFLKIEPIKLGALIQVANMSPLQLDATRDMPISLRDCLSYAQENSLSIRISKESYIYQKAQLVSQVAGFIPSFSLSYIVTKSEVLDPTTHSTSTVFAPRLVYPLFQGGSVLHSALGQLYRTKGWKFTHQTNVASGLLDTYKAYASLCLNHALLRIRIKAVDVSQAQLKLNEDKLKNGSGARYAVVQSRSQLASDQQALLAQQVATRQASLVLAYRLNLPLTINLVPADQILAEANIVKDQMTVDQALELAVQHRPELRQYEMFKYAANRSVQATASSLYPSVTISQSLNNANTTINSSTSTSTGGTSSSTSSSSSSSGSGTAGAGIYAGAYNTTQRAVSLSWSLQNMGLGTAANIVGARALARQAVLQANQELQLVCEQVRSDFITFKAARQQIDAAASAVAASQEALRLAEIRLRVGNGTNLELLESQSKYFSDLYSQANAITICNQAQAQLLADMGQISVSRLNGEM